MTFDVALSNKTKVSHPLVATKKHVVAPVIILEKDMQAKLDHDRLKKINKVSSSTFSIRLCVRSVFLDTTIKNT